MPKKILITGARAPVALHLSRLLSNKDTQIIMADSFHSAFSANSQYCSQYVKLPPPRFQRQKYLKALLELIEKYDIQIIIPTCEEIFYLSQIQKDLPVPVIAPPFETLQKVHHKYSFIQYAEGLGFDVPETKLLVSKSDVEKVAHDSRQLVFKPVWSRFAKGVLIRVPPQKLGKLSPTEKEPWLAQQYIAGTEISIYAVAHRGKLTALSAYKSLYRAGKGAGICFEAVNDLRIDDWVARFVTLSQWEGQISFDMILTNDGSLLPIECNPRATSGLHFFKDPAGFSQAFWQGIPTSPTEPDVLGSKLAMWAYAFPKAVISGEVTKFARIMKKSEDVFDWPDDPLPWHCELATFATIARIALCQQIGLQSAATRDIEWNGPDADALGN